MRVAGLFDVHGNLPALGAVLADVDAAGVDTIVVGGDVASGPMPVETLDVLRARGALFVRGNADRLDAGRVVDDGTMRMRGRRWVAERLGEERLTFLAGLPVDLTLELDGLGRVRFCHGAPGSDEMVITTVTSVERLRRLLAGVDESVVVCGHTHVQFDRAVDGIRVLNAGSVGAPYEAEPAAYWALFAGGVELRRTAYDVEATIRGNLRHRLSARGRVHRLPEARSGAPRPVERGDRGRRTLIRCRGGRARTAAIARTRAQ